LTLWGCAGDGGGSSSSSASAAAGSTATPASQPGPQPQVVPVQETFPRPPSGFLGVIGVAPGDFARNVSLTTPVYVRFSEPVPLAAVAASVTLEDGGQTIAGAWTPDADSRLFTFQPLAPLDPARHY